jgi:hypothetical protein
LFFPLNLHYFFHHFPNMNCQVREIKNQKKCVGCGEYSKYLNQKFH